MFAALALVIAGVGVFGVVSFTVARQQREFAVRNALGARPAQILSRVVRTNALLASAGAVSGAALASAFAPTLAGVLYEVPPRDVGILAAAPLAVLAFAWVAALGPAWRATRVLPAHLLQDNE